MWPPEPSYPGVTLSSATPALCPLQAQQAPVVRQQELGVGSWNVCVGKKGECRGHGAGHLQHIPHGGGMRIKTVCGKSCLAQSEHLLSFCYYH